MGVAFQVCNILTTFAWNFTDLFIILISCALAVRFKQIVKRLENNTVSHSCIINPHGVLNNFLKVMHEKFWKEVREDYNRLSRLCRTVDEHLAPLVIISFINNLFFICVQLYNSLKYIYRSIDLLSLSESVLGHVPEWQKLCIFSTLLDSFWRGPLPYRCTLRGLMTKAKSRSRCLIQFLQNITAPRYKNNCLNSISIDN